MSVRRKTTNRMTLYRQCGACGKSIVTTADTPWVRQLYNVDGKKQKTTYFCSEKCYASSYKYIGFYDGKAQERRRERDRNRDPEKEKARYKAYKEGHREEINAKRRAHYWEHREEELASGAYQRKKRKLLENL